MKTAFSDDHRLHAGRAELYDGRLQPCVERPERAEIVLARVREVGLGEVMAPRAHGLEPLRRVHADRFLAFLEAAWERWAEAHGACDDALPLSWAVRGLRPIEPETIDGQLGYFGFDAGTPITAGTWRAARAAADVALTAAELVAGGARAAFALCRPPGHHAARDLFGGYCFLNNAALAAQSLRDAGGAARVAVLDIDYHHGNGTQAIFYDRGDVLVASIHADPAREFPFFLGYADETGAGAGEGRNVNYPLPWGTPFGPWAAALDDACRRIERYGPDALVVSLGLDTFERDPISRFRLRTDDYPRVGERIARLKRPTLFVLEGGYAVAELGVNAVNVLTGFEHAA